MEKRKCFAILFCPILCYSVFLYAARAQSSPRIISVQGNITYLPLDVNLAVIPDDWILTYGSGPQIIFLDYSVVRTAGKPSIRLEPHVEGVDVNRACEADCTWYHCKPGDHIIAKIWIRTDPSTPQENADVYSGARLGMNFFAPRGDGTIIIVEAHPNEAEHVASIVRFGTSEWTLRTLDLIVPSTYYTHALEEDVTIPPAQITHFVIWVQMCHRQGVTASSWFADAELYINPT